MSDLPLLAANRGVTDVARGLLSRHAFLGLVERLRPGDDAPESVDPPDRLSLRSEPSVAPEAKCLARPPQQLGGPRPEVVAQDQPQLVIPPATADLLGERLGQRVDREVPGEDPALDGDALEGVEERGDLDLRRAPERAVIAGGADPDRAAAQEFFDGARAEHGDHLPGRDVHRVADGTRSRAGSALDAVSEASAPRDPLHLGDDS